MATRAGTSKSKQEEEVVEVKAEDEASVAVEESDAEVERAAEELEEKSKEDNKQAKQALSRLEKAVDNAREKGWTVSGRVDRLDVYGTSEGQNL